MLETDYVRTARLKGLSTGNVLFGHVLRNSLLPTVTVVAAGVGWLMGGLIVTESVFGYPGLGRLVLFAVQRRDLPLIQATTMLIVDRSSRWPIWPRTSSTPCSTRASGTGETWTILSRRRRHPPRQPVADLLRPQRARSPVGVDHLGREHAVPSRLRAQHLLGHAVNATFSAGQIVFEVPTGVIADTIGRRASFLIGIGALVVATLGYVGSSVFHWGLTGFILSSILLGFGFTCQTGAVDAWLVDALDSPAATSGSKDRVFARSGVFTGVSMLIGTLGGGFSGKLSLTIPYLVRTGLLVGVFVVTFVFMHEIGFTPRPLKLARFGEESRQIFGAGIRYGWRHPVVRPLLFTSLVNGVLVWYLFYASQPYALAAPRAGEPGLGGRS